MINILLQKYFLALIFSLNIATIFGFFVGKLNYKKGNNTKFMANLSLCLSGFFVLYTFCLIIYAMNLMHDGKSLFGLTVFALSMIPFFIGKLSTYKKADLYINWQIIALIVNLVIIMGCY